MTKKQISALDLSTDNYYINMLCYGLPGVGKTRAIATAPTPYLINIENNLMSLRGEKGIGGASPKNWPELKTVLTAVETRLEKKAFPYKTLCIDSLTEMGNMRLAHAEDVEKLSGYSLWGIVAKDLLVWLRRLKAMEIHIYAVCQAQDEKDEKTGVIKTSPAIIGNRIARELPYIFDEVFLLERSVNRDGVASSMFKTTGSGNAIVKDHSGKLNQYEPPNLTKIFNKALSIDISEFNVEDDNNKTKEMTNG